MRYPQKYLILLFIITFSFKLALGVYLSHLANCQNPQIKYGQIAIDGGDTFSYLGVMDNVLKDGDYYFWNGERKVYAGRMPYYGAPYFLLRLVFDKSTACDIYVVFQILLDSIATVLFALLCMEILSAKWAFLIGYLLYFGSFNLFAFSIALWTESLSLSFFIIFLYFYHRFWLSRSWPDAVYASILLALLVVLKPYLVLFYPAFFLGVLAKDDERFDFSKCLLYFRRVALLSLPLLVLLLPWIARNAVVLGKFIPAQENTRAGYNYSKSFLAFADFAGAWGSGSVSWDTNDAGCYFLEKPTYGCHFAIPEYAIADGYTLSDVEDVRADFLRFQANPSPELEADVVAKFNRLTEIYQREKPFMYYVGAKFIIAKRLFWHTNNYSLPIHPSFVCYHPFQLLFKIVQFFIYAGVLTFGVFGLLKLVFKRKVSILFVVLPLIILFYFTEIRTTEQRFVNPVYQILLLGLTSVCLHVLGMIQTGWRGSVVER